MKSIKAFRPGLFRGFPGVLLGAVFLLGLACSAAEPSPSVRPQLTAAPGSAKYFMVPGFAKDLISPDQTAEEQVEADAAWARIFEPVDGRSIEFVDEQGQPYNLMLGDIQRRKAPNWTRDVKELAWTEKARRALRDRGMQFWDEHPKDVRRYVWLFTATSAITFYWKDYDEGARGFQAWFADKSSRALGDVVLDLDAKAAWQVRFLAMRAEFSAATFIAEDAKIALRKRDLNARMAADLHTNKSPTSLSEAEVALRWTGWLRELTDLADRHPKGHLGSEPNNAIRLLEDDAGSYPQLYPRLKEAFLVAAKQSASEELKDFALLTAEEPVELVIGQPVPALRFTTLKNQDVDRRSWPGKVVLVDFWAFWCHACIEAMPHLKTLYDKYHDQGFEIYGVCFAEKGETPQKIVDLMTKMEIPWPQAMRDSLRKDRFGRIYSFTSLPQLMLLDKNGNLVAQNLYNMAELEAKIQELLAKKGPE